MAKVNIGDKFAILQNLPNFQSSLPDDDRLQSSAEIKKHFEKVGHRHKFIAASGGSTKADIL